MPTLGQTIAATGRTSIGRVQVRVARRTIEGHQEQLPREPGQEDGPPPRTANDEAVSTALAPDIVFNDV